MSTAHEPSTTGQNLAAGSASSGVAAPRAGVTRSSELDPPKPLGFGRLVAVEFRKLLDTASGRWVLAIIGIVTVLALTLMWLILPEPERRFSYFLGAVLTVQGVLLPLLGVLSATQEWAHRTATVTFTLEPRRLRVAAAKTVAALALGVLVMVVGALLALVVTAAATTGGDVQNAWELDGWTLAGSMAGPLLHLLVGVAFGMFVSVTWLAVLAYYLLPNVISALIFWEPAERIVPWIDFSAATAALNQGRAPTVLEWQHLASSCALWIVLPAVIGSILLSRREIS